MRVDGRRSAAEFCGWAAHHRAEPERELQGERFGPFGLPRRQRPPVGPRVWRDVTQEPPYQVAIVDDRPRVR